MLRPLFRLFGVLLAHPYNDAFDFFHDHRMKAR